MEGASVGTVPDDETLLVYLRPHEAGTGWELCLGAPHEPLLSAYSYAEALDLVSAVAGRQHANGRACEVYVQTSSTEGWKPIALSILDNTAPA